MAVRLSREESGRVWVFLLGMVFGVGCLILGVVVAVMVSYGQSLCFDELKRPVPCSTIPVVSVPEPVAWELVLAVLCLVAMYGWVWCGRRKR